MAVGLVAYFLDWRNPWTRIGLAVVAVITVVAVALLLL